MIYRTFKIYTVLLSTLFIFALGITVYMQQSFFTTPDDELSGLAADNPRSAKISLIGANTNPTDSGLSRNSAVLYKKVLNQSGNNAESLEGEAFWDSIRSHLQLSVHEEAQPAVQKQIKWLAKNPIYLRDAINQAAPYIYYIYDQVRQRNLPAELVLLPIIESGYNPSATNSASGATGLWQLMSSTAKEYGIRQDKAFDGRRNIYSSTKAALNYLSYLKNFFKGDWLLAIAAYDTGEGNVKNAVRRNTQLDKDTKFWALPLASETRTYVPRLLALAAIVKDPAKYGVNLPPVSGRPYLQVVEVPNMSLVKIAKLTNVSIRQLKKLNPGIKDNSALIKQGQWVLPANKVVFLSKQQSNRPLSLNG